MGGNGIVGLAAEYGPWVMLVFYLLYRDMQKDEVARAALERNTRVLSELNLLLRERLPRG
ncbi:hypothetical protein [Profundibacterium mesophilum]|uniref:Uncharacterized protein n=1 Tax=Profundibacterium mesophilum KAUST100406-0324 TaxID=1037889 RepID=A0A921TCX7_9RHOB|nr:hypothetical protein [Profundibacterium mesophilum]KAF0675676.1 hypothetical protein PMES_02011 [Profundibacterium mesophilum KAUST100406-0324]